MKRADSIVKFLLDLNDFLLNPIAILDPVSPAGRGAKL
jgi:hypothetical protein